MPAIQIGTFSTNDGVSGTVWADDAENPDAVTLDCPDGRKLTVAFKMLQRQADRSWLLPIAIDRLDASVASIPPAEPLVIPVVEERLEVGVRQFERGRVRVNTHTVSQEKTVDFSLVQEHIDIQRVPVMPGTTRPIKPHQEGDTWIIPVIEEVLVIEKRLVVREEIWLTTRREQTHDSKTVSLRSTEASVERIAGNNLSSNH